MGLEFTRSPSPSEPVPCKQPDFVEMFKEIQEDPMALQRHVQDPRILKVMESLMGVKVMSREDALREEDEKRRKEVSGQQGGRGLPAGAHGAGAGLGSVGSPHCSGGAC